MIFRLRFIQRGGHIHCRLFQAKAPGHTWEKNGDLVFDEAGWRDFSALMWGRIEMLPEDDATDTTPPVEATFTILDLAHGAAIECGLCLRVSCNRGDITNHYCGNCHIWHDLLAEVRAAARDGATHECSEWRTAIGYCAVCERPVPSVIETEE